MMERMTDLQGTFLNVLEMLGEVLFAVRHADDAVSEVCILWRFDLEFSQNGRHVKHFKLVS